MIKGRGVPFILLLAVLFLRPHLAGSAYPFAQGLFLVPLLVGLGLLLLVPGEGRRWSPGVLAVLCLSWTLSGWVLVSLLWSPDPGQGVREATALLGNVTAFSLAAWLIHAEGGDRDRLFPTLCLIVSPVLVSALYQRFSGFQNIRAALHEMGEAGGHVADLAPIIAGNRVFAGFLNPNMLAGFLAVTLCLTLDLLITSGSRKRVAVLSVLGAFQLLVLVLTGSAGGSAAALAAGCGVFLLRRGITGRTAVYSGGAILAGAAGVLAVRGAGFLLGPESSLAQRGGYMAAGLKMAMEHPVFGWGAGSSPGALMRYVAEGVRPVADPHNFIIRAWLEWGFPGVALLLGIVGAWALLIFVSYRRWGFRDLPEGALGLLFGACAFWLHSLLDMDFFVPETALFGWCAAGAALGMASIRPGADQGRSARGASVPGTVAGAAALVMVLPVFLYFQSESLAFRAGKAFEAGEFQAAASLYSQAGGLMPFNGRFVLEEGRARLAEGSRRTALSLFLRSSSLLPESPYPSWELGRMAQGEGDWEGSVPFLETALGRYPTSPRIRIDLALSYLNLGEAQKAMAALQEARRHALFDPEARSLVDGVLDGLER